MARPQSYDSDKLAELALSTFWSGGYHATSMDDLVRITGVSRHGIYKEFGTKKDMFLASFDRYQNSVVSPAFERVERSEADLSDVADYFEHQISRAERAGLPGPGCFVANAAVEMAPHDADVRRKVSEHNDRLRRGFASAIGNSRSPATDRNDPEIARLAEIMVVFATGLWSLSRVVGDADELRLSVNDFIDLIKGGLA